jgi:hypothetical protein
VQTNGSNDDDDDDSMMMQGDQAKALQVSVFALATNKINTCKYIYEVVNELTFNLQIYFH